MENNYTIPSLESLNFKNMRKERGLTLRQVENITGISNSYLSQLENGLIKSPSYNTVSILIVLYGGKLIEINNGKQS